MKATYIFNTFFLLFFSATTSAQTIKKAENQFNNIAYASSIGTYNQLGEPSNKTSLAQMANSFRMNGDYENAEYYFANLMTQKPDNEDVLHYAEVLLSNGKCVEAVKIFEEYQEKSSNTKRIFIKDCEELKAFSTRNIELKPLVGANTESGEFSATPFKGGVVFTSTRAVKSTCRDNWTGEGFADLYYADFKGENEIGTAERFGSELNMRYHDGATAFNKAGNIMYFSRTNPSGKNAEKHRDPKIFISYLKNGNWSDAAELPFNSDEFSTCHPTLSADGKRLYFSSNRPGGEGGMDIWVSNLENGRWANPKNLGANINTAGNEIFPFINEKETLFFSSNGQKGMGGLDVFSATNIKTNVFSKAENMGLPINSPKDDFAYLEKSDGKTGFLSSNRKGGNGADDIYFWKNVDNQSVKSIVKEEIAKAKEENPTENIVTGDLYKSYNTVISVIDAATGKEIAAPTVTIAGPNKTPKAEVNNNIPLMVLPSGQYTIKAENAGYISHTVTVEGIELLKTGTYKLPLSNGAPKLSGAYEMINGKMGMYGKTFSPGQIIELQDIYYDYNKANIRTDASVGLLRLAEVMLSYPSLEVELASHTDSRGKDTYNQALSNNRANEAVRYLVSRGIAASRMKARGYGETKLANACIEGVPCSEEEHQRNRRTEVMVTKFEEANTSIRKN